MTMSKINIIVSMGKNRVIGRADKLVWPIPEDLRHFKRLTIGHPVIMGRKTFESILGSLGKPLPGRTNIVVTRDTGWHHAGALVAHSLEEAIAKAREEGSPEIFISGGAQIYEQSLAMADKLYLTLVEDEQEGDAYFPEYAHLFTRTTKDEAYEWQGTKYRFVELER